MMVLSAKCNEKRFRSLTQIDLDSTTRLFRGYSYRTDDPASSHPSVYSRSRARRSARLHTVWGLSTKPALKRLMRCCRYWELETRSRKRRLTCEGRASIGERSYGLLVVGRVPLSSSGSPPKGETIGWTPRPLREVRISRWDPSPTQRVAARVKVAVGYILAEAASRP